MELRLLVVRRQLENAGGKMAAAKPAGVNLAALYSELNKLGENEDFARAIKVAKKSEFHFYLAVVGNGR